MYNSVDILVTNELKQDSVINRFRFDRFKYLSFTVSLHHFMHNICNNFITRNVIIIIFIFLKYLDIDAYILTVLTFQKTCCNFLHDQMHVLFLRIVVTLLKIRDVFNNHKKQIRQTIMNIRYRSNNSNLISALYGITNCEKHYVCRKIHDSVFGEFIF